MLSSREAGGRLGAYCTFKAPVPCCGRAWLSLNRDTSLERDRTGPVGLGSDAVDGLSDI